MVHPIAATPALSMRPLLADIMDLLSVSMMTGADHMSVTWSGARPAARSRRCPAAPPGKRRSPARRRRPCQALLLFQTSTVQVWVTEFSIVTCDDVTWWRGCQWLARPESHPSVGMRGWQGSSEAAVLVSSQQSLLILLFWLFRPNWLADDRGYVLGACG